MMKGDWEWRKRMDKPLAAGDGPRRMQQAFVTPEERNLAQKVPSRRGTTAKLAEEGFEEEDCQASSGSI